MIALINTLFDTQSKGVVDSSQTNVFIMVRGRFVCAKCWEQSIRTQTECEHTEDNYYGLLEFDFVSDDSLMQRISPRVKSCIDN